jgi:hypothetical protein
VFKITERRFHLCILSFNGRSGKAPWQVWSRKRWQFLWHHVRWGTMVDHGTVFRISPSGTFASLFSFSGTNGSFQRRGWWRAATAIFMAPRNSVERATTARFSRLRRRHANSFIFFQRPKRQLSGGPLVSGNDGNFYGTTSGDRSFGGTNTFGGVPDHSAGALTLLVSFDGTNGACPAGLTLGSDQIFTGRRSKADEGAAARFSDWSSRPASSRLRRHPVS